MKSISVKDWKWFGHAGHHIISPWCCFHLCTQVGNYLVSTVGEYLPDESVREIFAESRGIQLEGRGDDRRADYLRKIGFEEIGAGRKFETYVFEISGAVCEEEACGRCGMPLISISLQSRGYNTADDATRGHMEMCHEMASRAKHEAN